MRYLVILISGFLFLIFGNGIDYARKYINEYSGKVQDGKQNVDYSIVNKQADEIVKLKEEIEILRGINKALAKNQVESSNLPSSNLDVKKQFPFPVMIDGNPVICINTGITIECSK